MCLGWSVLEVTSEGDGRELTVAVVWAAMAATTIILSDFAV